MTESGTHESWDGDDGFAGEFEGGDVADAFAGFQPPQRSDAVDDTSDDDGVSTLLCTASNPAGTVSATALLSGRVIEVELSPEAARMTERELAEAIRIVAAQSNQQARAAQHAVIATMMDRLGRDPVATRSHLESELDLPSPDSVKAARAEWFSTHYAGDSEGCVSDLGDAE